MKTVLTLQTHKRVSITSVLWTSLKTTILDHEGMCDDQISEQNIMQSCKYVYMRISSFQQILKSICELRVNMEKLQLINQPKFYWQSTTIS